jgi:hypothetical protein
MQEAIGLEAAIVVPSIFCTLKLANIYDRITFPEEPHEQN